MLGEKHSTKITLPEPGCCCCCSRHTKANRPPCWFAHFSLRCVRVRACVRMKCTYALCVDIKIYFITRIARSCCWSHRWQTARRGEGDGERERERNWYCWAACRFRQWANTRKRYRQMCFVPGPRLHNILGNAAVLRIEFNGYLSPVHCGFIASNYADAQKCVCDSHDDNHTQPRTDLTTNGGKGGQHQLCVCGISDWLDENE